MKLNVLFLFSVSILISATSFAGSPQIVRGPKPGSDIVEYPRQAGQGYEAWEIVEDWVDGLYLNYSRAPWGNSGTSSSPIIVCSNNTAGLKIAGIGYKEDLLLGAIELVINDRLHTTGTHSIQCARYSDLLSKDPKQSDLRYFFKSL